LLEAMRATEVPDEPLSPVDLNVDENGLFIGEDDEDWGDDDLDDDVEDDEDWDDDELLADEEDA
jgi:23S rRNA pseudouridine1911/1915/1917 synthase